MNWLRLVERWAKPIFIIVLLAVSAWLFIPEVGAFPWFGMLAMLWAHNIERHMP